LQLCEIESRHWLYLDDLAAQVRLIKICLNIHLVDDCSVHRCYQVWISSDWLDRLINSWVFPLILYFNHWSYNSFPRIFERMSIINIEVLQFKVLFDLLWDIFYQVILELLCKHLSCLPLLFIDFITKYINVIAFALSKWLFWEHLEIFRIIFLLARTNFDDFNRDWKMSCS
jgi:hypothetical protein